MRNKNKKIIEIKGDCENQRINNHYSSRKE